MIKYLLSILIVFSGGLSYSQQLDSVQKMKILSRLGSLKLSNDYKKIIDSCDKYLFNEECSWFRDQLFVYKTQSVFILKRSKYFFERKFGLDIGSDCKIADSVTELLDSLILKESQTCNRNLSYYNRMRYEYYGGYGIVLPDLNNGKNKIYQREEFLALSPQFFYGNHQWVGIEIFAGVFQRKTRMKYIQSISMFSYEILRLGLRKNTSVHQGWGMNISYLSGSYKWINVRPINFSYLNSGENKSWGYSPELGIQVWYLHLNAGYNLAFKKSMRDYEKLYFTAKIDIPFYRF